MTKHGAPRVSESLRNVYVATNLAGRMDRKVRSWNFSFRFDPAQVTFFTHLLIFFQPSNKSGFNCNYTTYLDDALQGFNVNRPIIIAVS